MSELMKNYLFESERLGFRNWKTEDLEDFAEINGDPEVMEHFPAPLTRKETADFIVRLRKHFDDRGYTYFATEIKGTGELIGFIGLAFQDYDSKFTPATDIGWRLKKSSWGKGYATEGAKKCLEFVFLESKLESVISTLTRKNVKSEKIMQKLGMHKLGEYKHPKLKEYPEIEDCVCYGIDKEDWLKQDIG